MSGHGAEPSPAERGWVLYDGSCGFCSRWVPFWGPTLARRGFGFAALQDPWVVERLGGSEEQRLRDLLLLLRDGTRVVGADAYRFLMRRIWWARPFHALALAPGLRRVFDAAYRRFATHRHRVSAACGLSKSPTAGSAGSRRPARR